MAIIPGTPNDDIYAGTIGEGDTAQVNASQFGTTFRWVDDRWLLTSSAGADQLVSIEAAQFADALFQLRGPGAFLFADSYSTSQGQPGSVARLPDGSFVHTLASLVSSPGNYDILAVRISSGGELLSAFTVNTTGASAQTGPDIAVLTNGEFMITWQGPDSSGDGIYMQRFSAAGTPLGGEVPVNTITAYAEINSQVTVLSGNRYLVTWESIGGDGSGYGIFGQIYTAAGAPSGGQISINTTTANDQQNVSIAPLSDGGFVATYFSANFLKFQRFDSAGTATGPERTFGNSLEIGQGTAVLAGDRIVIVKTESYLVKVLTVDASGATTLIEETTISSLGQYAYFPTVTTLSDGGYVVAWYGDNGQGTYDLHVQRFDSNGLLVGGDQIIGSSVFQLNNGIEIAADTAGGYNVQFFDGEQVVQTVRMDADNLPVLPTITGDEGANSIQLGFGNTSGVRLNGLQGNDRLVGSNLNNDILDGGEGNDTLIGGTGDDTYIVTQQDRIIEALGAGIDTVIVRENYVLSARNVENIEIKGTAAANVTGNSLDNKIIGNRADNLINGGGGTDTMIGNTGNDTYLVNTAFDVVIERANEGIDTVITTISFDLPVGVENLRASGREAVALYGNLQDNLIVGNNANNVITDGRGGADILEGKGGDDVYYVTDERVQIIERAGLGGGNDSVFTLVSLTLDDNVENLTMGDSISINATGNDQNNSIAGNSGDNIIDGGAGADTMDGRGGSDIYIVDNALDAVFEVESFGTDEVRASVSYTISDDIENLTLTGNANINGTGNGGANLLRGNAGANILDGGDNLYDQTVVDRIYGYAGDDTLIARSGYAELFGGTGNDLYVVYTEGDRITELASQGVDTVEVRGLTSFELSANVENLILVDFYDTRGTGNNLNNQITGNLGNNVIDGGGGADTMTGSGGDDTYYVDNTLDVVVETVDDGEDTILSSVSYTASANAENLQLIGTALANATGNALDNVLYGNSATNSLSGLDGADILSGGDGNDSLLGGNGNDMLIGGSGNDTIDGGADIDTVNYRRATANITVDLNVLVAQATGAGSDRIVGVENVDGSGTGNDNLTGDSGANRLYGLGGHDTLTGGGGNDVLLGGEGVDTLGGGAGADRIDGGNGNDTVSFQLVAANITVDLSLSTAQNTGDGLDTIRNIENVIGSNTGNDTLTGDYLDNAIFGFGGNDTLVGGDGSDFLDGGGGIDTISYVRALDDVVVDLSRNTAIDDFGQQDQIINFERILGGAFDDTLTGSTGGNVIDGGNGRDVMRGAGGTDTFLYRSTADSGTSTSTRDLITDWAVGDRFDLSQIDANSVTAGDQAFTFIGFGSFSGVAGQLRQVSGLTGTMIIEGDVDGNSVADFSIAVRGNLTFAATDFAL